MAEANNATLPKPRVRALRRLAGIVLQYSRIVSILCYVAGLITVLLLPVLSKSTYISENALMPGSANSIYGSKSAMDARWMAEELQNVVTESTNGHMAVRRWAMKRMSAIGADFYLHTFSCPEKPFASMRFFSNPQHIPRNGNATTDDIPGVNVVGIIKAPRSEGNEAVVLVTPFTLEGGELSSADKVTLSFGMSLFELYGHTNWLARDIIWILADARYGSHTAVAAWLQEYHEPRLHLLSRPEVAHRYRQIEGITEGLSNEPLLEFKRAGFISAGLVFDVKSGFRGQVDSIKVSGEGPNGQMPNLDLINVVNTLAQWRRLNIHLDVIKGMQDSVLLNGLGRVIENIGRFAGKMHGEWGFVMTASAYVESLATLCASIFNQALGGPSGAHGAFRDYQIDAVTLNMIAGGDLETSSYQIDLFTRYGRLVEGVMRSVNNLLEKFHQSFFLYLLCGPNKYVSVGVYMIPLGLLLITLPLGSAALNSALVKTDEVLPSSGSSQVLNLGYSKGWLTEDSTLKKVEEVKGLTRDILDIKTSKENAGRWRHAIIVVTAVQLWASVVALLPPMISPLMDLLEMNIASLTSIVPVSGVATMSLKMALWIAVALVSFFAVVNSFPVANPGDWMAIKALVLGMATIGLVVMSQVDFAVSLVGAVVLVPTCLCCFPLPILWRKNSTEEQKRWSILTYISMSLGTIITVMGSPPVLVAAAAFYAGQFHWQAILGTFWQWTELLWFWGSGLYIYVVVVHLPCSILSLYIVLF